MVANKSAFGSEREFIEDERTDNVYDMDDLDEFVENDMISATEEGFMLGYLGT